MGPKGMAEIGETILQNAAYARKQLDTIPGVKTVFGSTFKEFVVSLDDTGKTVSQVNQALKEKGILVVRTSAVNTRSWASVPCTV